MRSWQNKNISIKSYSYNCCKQYLLFIYFYIYDLIPIAQIEGCLSFTEVKSGECRQEGRKVFVLQVPHTSTVLGSVDLGLTLHGSNACPKQLKHGYPWYAVQSWNFLSSDRNWIRSFRVVNLIYICYSLILWFGGSTKNFKKWWYIPSIRQVWSTVLLIYVAMSLSSQVPAAHQLQ